MKPGYFVDFLLFFGIYSYVKPYNVQITKLTPHAGSFKFLQDIFGPSLSEILNNKGIYCPKVTFTMQPAPHSETKSSRRIIRQVHTKYPPFATSLRPVLRRITSAPAPSLKERLNIFLPFSPNNYIPETNRLPLNNLNYHINKIGRNITNNLLLAKAINFSNQVTTPIYSTIPNMLTHSLDDSIVSTARQSAWINNQKSNSISANDYRENEDNLVQMFFQSLEQFESLFYQITFNKLLLISPAKRQQNGISFIQSALFLYLALLAISTEVDESTRLEIENCLRYKASKMDKIKILKHMMSWLPNSNSNIKFRWTSRLVLNSELPVSQWLVDSAATTGLRVDRLNYTDAPDVITKTLNRMVVDDSGGAMRNTFEEDEILEGVCSILLTTVYIRPRWRSAPTVLNNTRRFYDTNQALVRSVRMIRINDEMHYAALDEWNADMGISRLIRNFSRCDELRLSHAVQRLMFWAEAGHNAFKDDGIEWDETPELELVVNRPYLFYVRWKNITLINGNFVL